MHSVNLLPPAANERFQRQRVILTWSKVLLSVAVVTAGIVAWGQTTATHHLRHTTQQESLAERPRHVRKQCAALQVQLRQLEQHETVQRAQRSRFSPLVPLQLLHHAKAQLHGQLQVRAFEFVDLSPEQHSSSTPASNGHLVLQLVSQGPTSCSQLIQHIRDTGYFTDVQLSSSLERRDSTGSQLQYALRCEF